MAVENSEKADYQRWRRDSEVVPREEAVARLKAFQKELGDLQAKHRIPNVLAAFNVMSIVDDDWTCSMGIYKHGNHGDCVALAKSLHDNI